MKLGTIGTGFIVHNILDGVQLTEGICCEAVYSRSRERGQALAEKYGVKKVYTDLTTMLEDPEVDFVYVASPNSLHFTHAKQALEHGKHVICEKPFTTSREKAQILVDLAKEKGLFLFDAVPPSFLPNFDVLKQQLPKIGRLRLVMSNFSQYSSRYDALLAGNVPNIFSLEYAGGCLQDINFYNLYMNVTLFGKPKHVVYYPNMYPGQADTSGVLVLQYEDFVSSNVGAKDTWGINFLQLEGEKGYLYVKDGTSGLTEITLVTREGETVLNRQEPVSRWLYEVQEITRLVHAGDLAECYRRLDVMLDVVEILEKARKDTGILFPCDEL